MPIEGYCVKCGIEVGRDIDTKHGKKLTYHTNRDFVKLDGAIVCKACYYQYPCYGSPMEDY